MKTKHIVLTGFITSITLLSTGCGVVPGTSIEKVEPGYVGLKIPLYGGDKGIEGAELVNGNVWFNSYTEDVVTFPTFMNTYSFTRNATEGSPTNEEVSFSVAGSPVTADVGVSFLFKQEGVKEFYKTYKKEPSVFRANEFRNALRNCAGEVSDINKLTPSKLSVSQQALLKGITVCLQKKFSFLDVQEVSLLGPIRLSPDIQKSIDEQFAAQQAAQTAESNARKIQAEALSNVAKAKGDAQVAIENAKALAETNRLTSASITPNLITMERLKNEKLRIEKWDGKQAPTIQTPNVQLGGVTADPAK